MDSPADPLAPSSANINPPCQYDAQAQTSAAASASRATRGLTRELYCTRMSAFIVGWTVPVYGK